LELIALHLFLLLEGMKVQNPGQTELAQRTIEAFVADMDDCMREMGVGDMAVGKKVKRAAAAFYERTGAYRSGIASSGRDLEDRLGAYIFPDSGTNDGGSPDGAGRLARYVRDAAALSSEGPFCELVGDGRLGRLLDDNRIQAP
jgi:cytochrome b pre-mRNA-processing protein 3